MTRALIAHQVPRTPERFSRVLGQANPSVRSSTARIVPMATKQRVSKVDAAVGWFCIVVGGTALLVFAGLGWLP